MNVPHRSTYQEIEEFQQALGHIWDVEITQSETGPMETFIAATRVNDCLVYESGSNTSLLCSGSRSDDFWTISPITHTCAGGRFRGHQLDAGQILLLDPGGEVYQQVAAGQRQQAISIPLDLAERICETEYGLSAGAIWGCWCIRADTAVTVHIAGLLGRLLSEPWVTEYWGVRNGADLAAHIISLAASAPQNHLARSSLVHRRRIVGLAEELIRSRLDNPPSVSELCEITHTSRRLLFYAFRELLGRTPSAHAKILRLHVARRQIAARSNERCVQQIASDLGFCHLGQFAIDYARLFGESPSKTRQSKWSRQSQPLVMPFSRAQPPRSATSGRPSHPAFPGADR
ncbi:helix-turn-helix domain-containing protein [Marinobacter orientalis]|uniref:Helix-turn-helix domain-containing protein n=1 Tax=Marinobacter orientalis TaxID=1928859 RepID=A0A7Y0WRK9_9GAMM|nr:helix-turn-helix domain-containing protein [Marinobacter orientalis]NMT63129.1 helix-turn-helix domain-containing protein [Marinobacter orientalis]TGX51785.1 helix-turn-helix domain-containing protein [Marinobacter orientalis]